MASDLFSVLRQSAGLTTSDVATEFGRSIEDVAAWDSGVLSAPAHVVRSLEVLSSCSERPVAQTKGDDFSAYLHSYEAATTAEHRKRLGQVFTPESVASLMASWIMEGRPKTVLDPAIGTGKLVRAVLDIDPDTQITGIELDPKVLAYLPVDLKSKVEIIESNALTFDQHRSFDAVIMNPPYIRHRELQDHSAIRALVASVSETDIPKSANLYVDFVLKACVHLKPGGRGAFLIPAEWMSANFSQSLKLRLLRSGWLKSLVTFSNCSSVFDGALTTASLVLVEKSEANGHVESHFLQSIDASQCPRSLMDLHKRFPPKRIQVSALSAASKWEPIIRGDATEVPDGWTTLGELVQPRRGIATGSNSFYLVPRSIISKFAIRSENIKPCVGRANDVAGLIFNDSDFASLDKADAKVWLIDFITDPTESERNYITIGEEDGVHARYIPRMRNPWYTMEKREPSPIWAGVFGRGDLKFVYNEAGIRSLTNFHCVYPKMVGARHHKALVALLNSQEVRNAMAGHRRGYGGGLAKFEPNDLKAIPVPDIRKTSGDVLDRLASLLDDMDRSERAGNKHGSVSELIAEIGSGPSNNSD